MNSSLPIYAVIPQLRAQLAQQDHLILEAEPGAGKTSCVPLELMNEPWLGDQKILMLEPRRLAARAAAERLAQSLGEPVGQRVGLRMRLENLCSPQTRIEVVTEGVLIQQILRDPELNGIGLVILDEFHERSLQADLALLLCQEVNLLRDTPMKLLLMSATLDSTGLSQHLNGCPVLTCPGRTHPIDLAHSRDNLRIHEILPALVKRIETEVSKTQGDTLVFLPGRAEIERTYAELSHRPLASEISINRLFGAMDLNEQHRVLSPDPERRQIILATSIAQTSITLPRVDLVIDTGLERVPNHDPKTGISQLETQRISQATATQRAGRAGRTGPGRCFRMWSDSQQQQLRAQDTPEIVGADLSAVMLQLLDWGIDAPGNANWLDAPPKSHWQAAQHRLSQLGLISANRLSTLGKQVAHYPTGPEIALLLHRSAERGVARLGALTAALLSEQHRIADTHLPSILAELNSNRGPSRVRQLAKRLQRLIPQCRSNEPERDDFAHESELICTLLEVFPGRLCKVRERSQGRYQLATGTAVLVDPSDALCQHEWLLALDLGGKRGASGLQLRLGVGVERAMIETQLGHSFETEQQISWDPRSGKPSALERARIGCLTVTQKVSTSLSTDQKHRSLCAHLRTQGIDKLECYQKLSPWLSRVNYLAEHSSELDALTPFLPLSLERLTDDLTQWFTPELATHINNLKQLDTLDLKSLLYALLPWQIDAWLDQYAPASFLAPSGRQVSILYESSRPQISIKLQELFGLETLPRLQTGDSLAAELLSPAGRPLALTHDLNHFWNEIYPEVRKEMRGRYSKHPWPEDPLSAEATAKTNAALRAQK